MTAVPAHVSQFASARRTPAPVGSGLRASGATRAAGATRAGGTTRLRITRRGQIVVAVLLSLLLAAVLAAVAASGASSAVATTGESASSYSYVTVQSGQTLWGIAEEVAPRADPRDVIADISNLNQLQTSKVHPGQRLALPLAYAE